MGKARGIAHDIINGAFAPERVAPAQRSPWSAAIADLEATPDLRPESIRAYKTAITAVRSLFPDLTGPADVTEEIATRFKREFLAGTFKRGKADNPTAYKRSPTTCATLLRSLRSLWTKHFRPFGQVTANSWREVPFPNAP